MKQFTKILCLLPLLFAAACSVTDEQNGSTTLSIDENRVEQGADVLENGAEKAGDAAVNALENAPAAIEESAADIKERAGRVADKAEALGDQIEDEADAKVDTTTENKAR